MTGSFGYLLRKSFEGISVRISTEDLRNRFSTECCIFPTSFRKFRCAPVCAAPWRQEEMKKIAAVVARPGFDPKTLEKIRQKFRAENRLADIQHLNSHDPFVEIAEITGVEMFQKIAQVSKGDQNSQKMEFLSWGVGMLAGGLIMNVIGRSPQDAVEHRFLWSRLLTQSSGSVS